MLSATCDHGSCVVFGAAQGIFVTFLLTHETHYNALQVAWRVWLPKRHNPLSYCNPTLMCTSSRSQTSSRPSPTSRSTSLARCAWIASGVRPTAHLPSDGTDDLESSAKSTALVNEDAPLDRAALACVAHAEPAYVVVTIHPRETRLGCVLTYVGHAVVVHSRTRRRCAPADTTVALGLVFGATVANAEAPPTA